MRTWPGCSAGQRLPAGRGHRTAFARCFGTSTGRFVWFTGPAGAVGSWTYCGGGDCLTRTVSQGCSTAFEYTRSGLLAARTDPGGARHEFVRDPELCLTEFRNPLGL